MPMSDATMAKKANDLRTELEMLIETAQSFKNGEIVENQVRRIREVLASDDFKRLSNVADEFRFLKCYVENSNFEKILEVNYLAVVTESFIRVLENHKIVPTENMICKLLECASYQKWQEIKSEAWGKNTKSNCVTRM